MRYRVDFQDRPARPRGRRATPRVTLAMAAVVGGVLACVPRAPGPSAMAVRPQAAQGLVSVAAAAPRPAPAPAAVAPAAVAPPPAVPAPPVAPAFRIEAEHEMTSTAYCLKGRTRTGVRTRDGVAAADPDFLPLGSVVRLSFPDGRPLGVFVVMDTGGAVRGKKIDIYMESCQEATRWGSKRVVAEVLDLGRAR